MKQQLEQKTAAARTRDAQEFMTWWVRRQAATARRNAAAGSLWKGA